MSRYVALLRGVTPSNPAMANANLREVCEGLGLDRVATVISSGNVVFDTDRADRSELEAMLEAAWPRQLGFTSTTVVRSKGELEALVEMDPFAGREHGPQCYLLVTFAKRPLRIPFDLPYAPDPSSYRLVAATESELFTVTDTTSTIKTPDVMGWVASQFGPAVTSRTWLTVHRILKRMASP